MNCWALGVSGLTAAQTEAGKKRAEREVEPAIDIDIHWSGELQEPEESVLDSWHREGLDRPSIPLVSLSPAPSRNLKGFPSGIDDTRRGKQAGVCKLLSSYRNVCAFKTLELRRCLSCGNLRRTIPGTSRISSWGPFPLFPSSFLLLFSFFFSFHPKATSSLHPLGTGEPAFLLPK